MNQKAIARRPGDYQVWGNLGSAYLWSGEHDKSVQAYRKAIELGEAERTKSPDDTNLLVQLGDYYASSGQAGPSEVLLRKALALSPMIRISNTAPGKPTRFSGSAPKRSR